MPKETTVLQIFVASPSDVAEERIALEIVVTQLNQIWSKSLGLTLELIKWETNVHPSFSRDVQSVINEQINQDYDIFIGIFWNRIGTPTPRATSGSIEEFNNAFSRFQLTKNAPEIMLYFKDAPIAPSKIEIDQLNAVLNFKKSLSDKGGLYSIFEDQTSFESSLRAHLSAIVQKFAQKRPLTPSNLTVSEVTPYDDDYGYIDYMEIYTLRQAEMTASIEIIADATRRIGEQMNQKSKELNNEVVQDTKTVRRHIKRVADDMCNYADVLSTQVNLVTNLRKIAFNALSNALVLRGDFQNSENELKSNKNLLLNLSNSMMESKIGMGSMRSAAESLPRISKELNLAKRLVVTQLDAFLHEIDNACLTINNIIESINKMILVEQSI